MDGSSTRLTGRSREEFSASKDGCNVRIGTNRFIGDLRRYRITAGIEDVTVDIELIGEVAPSRPKSGHTYFARPRVSRNGCSPGCQQPPRAA